MILMVLRSLWSRRLVFLLTPLIKFSAQLNAQIQQY